MNDSAPRIGPLDGIVVLNGLGHGQTPLKGQDHCSKNGRDNGHGLQLVQKVSKSVDMGDLVQGTKVFSNSFQDGAEEKDVVENGQKYQDPVENTAKKKSFPLEFFQRKAIQ